MKDDKTVIFPLVFTVNGIIFGENFGKLRR